MSCFVVGHRGARNLAPENTIASMRRALEIGVNELEIDLRLSSDGEIVIMHDAEVDRTTDGSGRVSELTLAQLRALDAGDGERIPTFSEVLEATTVELQVEIKDPAVIDPLMELLRGKHGEEVSRLGPTSFDTDSVARLAALLPTARVGLITRDNTAAVLEQATDLGARRVLVGYDGLERWFVEAAHERGFRVDVWPIDTPEQVRAVVSLGADGFTTDDPRIVRQAGFRVGPGGLVEVS